MKNKIATVIIKSADLLNLPQPQSYEQARLGRRRAQAQQEYQQHRERGLPQAPSMPSINYGQPGVASSVQQPTGMAPPPQTALVGPGGRASYSHGQQMGQQAAQQQRMQYGGVGATPAYQQGQQMAQQQRMQYGGRGSAASPHEQHTPFQLGPVEQPPVKPYGPFPKTPAERRGWEMQESFNDWDPVDYSQEYNHGNSATHAAQSQPTPQQRSTIQGSPQQMPRGVGRTSFHERGYDSGRSMF